MITFLGGLLLSCLVYVLFGLFLFFVLLFFFQISMQVVKMSKDSKHDIDVVDFTCLIKGLEQMIFFKTPKSGVG